jgi:hypothetical protein
VGVVVVDDDNKKSRIEIIRDMQHKNTRIRFSQKLQGERLSLNT